MTFIKCSRCRRMKPTSAFPKNASKRAGHDSECRRCKRNRENTEEYREAKRFQALLRKYGITREEYETLYSAQDGRCAVCDRLEDKTNEYGEPMPLVVDHNHDDGEVRGLLCTGCNKALGLLGDDPHVISAAHLYLSGWRRARGGWERRLSACVPC
jgi:hypothetical protein